MRRKFIKGYRQGSWEIVEDIPYKSKKALMRCDCGHEGWYFISNLSSHKSTKCNNCRFQSPEHKTFLSVVNTANRRKIKWEISENDWIKLSSMDCYYCGAKPNNILSHAGYKYNGLDRIDSSKHYFIKNVVASCKICNRAKSDLNKNEFYEWIGRVYASI